jgi:CubicO group peptidase (beta-lactamase class C family)
MPQRPEFFMGGGGAFSTPRNYMAFLQALLNGGALHGVRILRTETVAMMMQNQIGELNVHEMRSAQAPYSRSFDQFPGQPHKWGPLRRRNILLRAILNRPTPPALFTCTKPFFVGLDGAFAPGALERPL